MCDLYPNISPHFSHAPWQGLVSRNPYSRVLLVQLQISSEKEIYRHILNWKIYEWSVRRMCAAKMSSGAVGSETSRGVFLWRWAWSVNLIRSSTGPQSLSFEDDTVTEGVYCSEPINRPNIHKVIGPRAKQQFVKETDQEVKNRMQLQLYHSIGTLFHFLFIHCYWNKNLQVPAVKKNLWILDFKNQWTFALHVLWRTVSEIIGQLPIKYQSRKIKSGYKNMCELWHYWGRVYKLKKHLGWQGSAPSHVFSLLQIHCLRYIDSHHRIYPYCHNLN